MSKPTAEEIAQEIVARMRASGHHAMTVKWKHFYEMTGRERVTAPFLENVEVALKAESILMATGVTVIAFLSDYDFAPIRPLKAPSPAEG
jgi:hypothetical protein